MKIKYAHSKAKSQVQLLDMTVAIKYVIESVCKTGAADALYLIAFSARYDA
jgi:hypothetical protein